MKKVGSIARKNQFDGSMLFGTKDFNKKTGRNEHYEHAIKIQTEYFIDPRTGILYDHMSEKRDCPICGASASNTLFIKDGFRHAKCECGFIFVDPTASDTFRNHFFEEKYQTWTGVLLTSEQEQIDALKFQYGLEFIEQYSGTKGLLVDIGAGAGLFLKVSRDAGWQVSGVEFNLSAVEHIKKLGIEVFSQPLDEGIYKPESVDVVTAWEVLEHINDPNRFLVQIKDVLKKEGLIFICVPNINALVTRILHEKARTFGGSSHVNFFAIETITKLLEKNGFEVLAMDTVISELGTIRNYLCYEEPYGGNAELWLDFLTPEYLYEHDLGSRIFILGQKR